MYPIILLGTDGSATATAATQYAVTLARQLQAQLRALYVTDIRILEGPLLTGISGALGAPPYSALLPKLQEIQRAKAAAILGAVAQQARAARVSCKTAHETGGLVNVLLDYEKEADLVVLGQRGEHAQWTGNMLGSSVERLLRASVKPCLVTPAQFRELHSLLLAYDGSGESRKALQTGINLADALKAELTILTVCQGETEDNASRFLKEALDQARSRSLSAHAQLAHGNPETEILTWAAKLDADLIVMGAYGHTRIREFILGSATAHVLHKAQVPVLLARG